MEELGIQLVDCPGYGFARVSQEEKEEWKHLMMAYFQHSAGLHRAIMLVDAEVGLQDSDKLLVDMLAEMNQVYMFVLTKADKVSSKQI